MFGAGAGACVFCSALARDSTHSVRQQADRVGMPTGMDLRLLHWDEWASESCLGPFRVEGISTPLYLVPSPDAVNSGAQGRLGRLPESQHATAVQITHGARYYFSDSADCSLDYSHYSAWPLVDKEIGFSVDLSAAGCGCNVAAYVVSMHQNARPGECGYDYYCVRGHGLNAGDHQTPHIFSHSLALSFTLVSGGTGSSSLSLFLCAGC